MKTLFPNAISIFWMIHFPPLLGFKWYPGQETILQKAKEDLRTLERGWVDAIIIENNYDLPHTKYLDPEIITQMTFLAWELRKETTLPLWICCLWNDWKSALSIAKVINLQFVRIPVFVDTIKTHYGFEIQENPEKILAYKKKIGAEHIKIITDIHVKHCEIMSSYTLEESCKNALNVGSDGLIITGKWTADLPKISDLEALQNLEKNPYIIIGSGVSDQNISQVKKYTDAMIIWTYFKTKNLDNDATNIRKWEEKIDEKKVKKLVNTL